MPPARKIPIYVDREVRDKLRQLVGKEFTPNDFISKAVDLIGKLKIILGAETIEETIDMTYTIIKDSMEESFQQTYRFETEDENK
ncbi:hypothetical protein J7L00_03505 [Candidatus Bathyarchaeota archaeon]|nr:hypothetical protein [Candidatus Bathyarchaeota archaeon]